MKKISVIVPVYNGEKQIENAIQSALSQTYRNTEIIIINDGSTDGTSSICRDLCEAYERIRLIEMENCGVTSARIAGVCAASGEILAFLDADDTLDADYLEQMVRDMGDADFVAAGIRKTIMAEDNRVVFEKNETQSGVYCGKELMTLYETALHYGTPFTFGVLPYMCNKLYKKSLLLPIMKRTDPKIYDGEDVTIVFPYLLLANKVVVTGYCGYQYFIHSDSASRQRLKDGCANASRIYLSIENQLREAENGGIFLPQLRSYFLYMVFKNDPGSYLYANEYPFPFAMVKSGSRIILYGAGDVGNAYYVQFRQSRYGILAGWADKNVRTSTFANEPLISPEEIFSREFDIVVIALKSPYIAASVKEYLINGGVEEQQIVWAF